MIYQLFIRDRLVALWLKLLNSAIVTGLFYGFLTTFSIGPSYLFLIRARVMDEGTETEIAATTGFITGQLMMFISIYYAPLHLALIRPHTITALTLPYLFFNFVYQNNKHYYSDSRYYLDSGYKNPNSIRKFRIYKVFVNNLFFQLSNPILLPSSILLRLMNIYLFRSNNKLLFLTSSFLGWLIGHIFLMRCIGLILLVWSKQKNSIKSKLTMRFSKYILLELRNYVGQIFVVFSLVIFVHYLGRAPLPYLFSDEILELEEEEKGKDEINVEIDSETEETKQEQNGSIEDEEDLISYLFPKKDKTLDNIEQDYNIFALEKPLVVTTLFDYRKWNRPLRYIKNDHFERAVRDENSQFFFNICQSDGNERISFTYPPDLSSFLKIMENKMDLFTRDKISYNDNELSNYWSSTNNEKRKKLTNEFLKRAKVLDKKYKKNKKCIPVDVFDNRIRLSNDKRKRKYLTKIYDPFLNGPFRGQSFSPSIQNETYTTNSILINKIHGLLLSIHSNYPDPEFEQKIDQFDSKFLLTEIGFFFNLMSKFSEKSVSSFNFDGLYLFPEHEQVNSEEKKRKKKFLFEAIRTDRNNQTIFNRKKCSGINEISKQVPRWSYKIIDEVEQVTERLTKEYQIRAPIVERIVIFDGNTDSLLGAKKDKEDEDILKQDLNHEFFLINVSREPDYDREIIKGSMRPLRRKTSIMKLGQGLHSPLFVEMLNPLFFIFGDLDIFEILYQYWKQKFRKPGTDNSEFEEFEKKLEEKYEEEEKDERERRLRKIEEDWESILYGLIIRSFVLLIQSFIRKYIIIPSLIITKNIIRILLFQNPEWSEDFRDWSREVHINCTYQGIPVSHKELPKNWFNEGLQIRILYPFVLKPWHNSKVQSTEKKKKKDPQKKKYTEKKKKYTENKNFWFLTGYGTLVESYLDEGYPSAPLSFLDPVLKKISKQLKKDLKKRFFLVLKFLNERKKWFRTMLKKIENWDINIKIKRILVRFKTVDETIEETIEETIDEIIDELSESKKTSTNNSKIEVIEESPVQMESINWTSFTEKRIKDLNVKTKTIIKEIETMIEENKEGILTSEINLNSNKTTYDAKRLELQKNILQILQRRFVRLIRKSDSFFKIFIEGVYIDILDILLCISSLARIHRQRFLESIDKIVNVKKSIYYKKKMEERERIKKKMEERERIENQSLPGVIPMPFIDKSGNFVNMNSENSLDLSFLTQGYVCYKLTEIPFNNEIKDSFFGIQETSNSKLKHKKRPDSFMNDWTNWLKLHYQYDLPENRWSKLVSENWRNRINEHRVAQNKDLVSYDSYEKNPLILFKKQEQEEEGDIFEIQFVRKIKSKMEKQRKIKKEQAETKRKINKQYRYDLFCYQYLHFADNNNKKSFISGYRSEQEKKNQAISYNYYPCRKEFMDCIGDISIQNYLEEYDILDMKKNLDRKYFNWVGMNRKRKKTSLPISRFWFFSKLNIFYSAYKMNPWILPIKLFLLPLSRQDELVLETKKYVSSVDVDLKPRSYYEKYYFKRSNCKYRIDLRGERDFLISKYLGFYLHCDSSDEEIGMDNINLFILLLRMKNFKKIVIRSIQKLELDIEMLVDSITKDSIYTECRDTEDLKNSLTFFIEPIRLSRRNHEQSLIYQTLTLPLIHKSKRRKSWSWKRKKSRVEQKIRENKDKNFYDLFIPENLLSTRRRRELRILTCFNPRDRKTVHRKTIKDNENKIKNVSQVLANNKDLDSEIKKLMNFKLFLWPNYRLEDLACINRYWFNTHNGSHFSILRILMYPRLKD
uniref:hypothetical protein RF1 n=1 Tax=Medicago murex TaxID=75627 RepID=UPI00226CD899|nr:hypothetical protein RF1 [Medicago murex]UZC30607.1 hypothetical protein RF1 [Medicago murex]UZC30683.1 hypothetical protein RF1 [Medicago murex]